uniref:Uncharacterized protein n=1 Tax=Tetraselmis chuii TaxID=63592 RepID=A0A7S1SUT2_9CHLO|mmetsp:Transcript_26753/g.47641  ORF Transcript_26753/g.47641 Transcript_26753/m.47641 type:complete len:289 (+) Transcript_26753:1-867(+)
MGGGGEKGAGAASEDPLDEFMSGMEVEMEEDKLKRLRAELRENEAAAAKTERLLKVADPDGWFRPQKGAASEAKAAALKEMMAEKQARAAAEAARRLAAMQAAKAAKEANTFVPEVEEEEEEAGAEPAAAVAKEESGGGVELAEVAPVVEEGVSGRDEEEDVTVGKEGKEDGERRSSDAGGGVRIDLAGAVKRKKQAGGGRKRGGGGGGLSGLLSREEVVQKARGGTDLHSRAAARVADTMAILQRSRRPAEAEADTGGAEGAAAVEWKPPEGQTGDGRTALNDKLGY